MRRATSGHVQSQIEQSCGDVLINSCTKDISTPTPPPHPLPNWLSFHTPAKRSALPRSFACYFWVAGRIHEPANGRRMGEAGERGGGQAVKWWLWALFLSPPWLFDLLATPPATTPGPWCDTSAVRNVRLILVV